MKQFVILAVSLDVKFNANLVEEQFACNLGGIIALGSQRHTLDEWPIE